MVALTRAIPPKAAFELLTTGRLIDAREALSLGLLNRVADPAELTETTMDLAQTVAGKLGRALRIGKQAFYAQSELPESEAYAYAGRRWCRTCSTPRQTKASRPFSPNAPPTGRPKPDRSLTAAPQEP